MGMLCLFLSCCCFCCFRVVCRLSSLHWFVVWRFWLISPHFIDVFHRLSADWVLVCSSCSCFFLLVVSHVLSGGFCVYMVLCVDIFFFYVLCYWLAFYIFYAIKYCSPRPDSRLVIRFFNVAFFQSVGPPR